LCFLSRGSPEADGVDAVIAGHTRGGRRCLPFYEYVPGGDVHDRSAKGVGVRINWRVGVVILNVVLSALLLYMIGMALVFTLFGLSSWQF
jgi:hypothetical protein